MKSFIKELIIILLLCLAIILILGIILYEYVPTSKTIPNAVSYTTPDEVKEELLATDSVDESQIVMTYEVNSSDLNNYKRIQDYKPGKANPFSSYETTGSDTQSNGSSNGNASTGNSSSGTNNSSGNSTGKNEDTTQSGGHFFQETGTK